MQKKFVSNLALLLFLNLLIKPFWILGIDREVQNVVGAEDYGLYFTLFNFSFLFTILLDAGITNFNNRNIAQHRQLVTKHLSGIAVLKFMLGVAYMVITLSVGWVMGYSEKYLGMLLLLGVNQFLLSFLLYLRSNLSGLHFFKTDSLLSVLDRTVMIIISAGLLWGGFTDQPFQIEWFVYAQTASYLFAVLVAFGTLLGKVDFFRPRWQPAFFRVILRQSLPFALLVLLMTIYYRVDAVMLERLLPEGKVASGTYAQAFRLLDASTMMPFLFAGLLLPIFSRMLKEKENVSSLTLLATRLLLAPALALAIMTLFFNLEIMDLLYLEQVQESSAVLPVLMFSLVGISLTYIYGTLLTANGSLRYLNIMATGGVLLNIALNAILIPQHGSLGAAWATLVTQVLTALVQVWLCYRFFQLDPSLKFTLSLLLFCLATTTLGWGLTNFDLGDFYTWKLGLVAYIGGSILLAWISGLVSPKALVRIIRAS